MQVKNKKLDSILYLFQPNRLYCNNNTIIKISILSICREEYINKQVHIRTGLPLFKLRKDKAGGNFNDGKQILQN